MASIRIAIMITTTSVPQPTISVTIPQSLRYLVLPLNCNDSSDFTNREPEQSRGRSEIFTAKARECQKVRNIS
jgi:hypothetical protein